MNEVHGIDPEELYARKSRVQLFAPGIVDGFKAAGMSRQEGLDALAYLIGFIRKSTGEEINMIDLLAMIAAGQADALVAKQQETH